MRGRLAMLVLASLLATPARLRARPELVWQEPPQEEPPKPEETPPSDEGQDPPRPPEEPPQEEKQGKHEPEQKSPTGGEANKDAPAPNGEEKAQEEPAKPPEAPPGSEATPKPAPPAPGPRAPLEGAPSVTEATAAPDPAPSRPAVTWPLGIDAIDVHMRGIAETHPEVASVEVLGASRSGREILALRLGLGTPAERAGMPVLLLVDFQGPPSAGAEALLDLAWHLVTEAEHDERTHDLLTRAGLLIVPALDPDARTRSEPPAVRFDRNFPSGWQPDSIRPGSGRVTLSEPETLAAARALVGLEGCAVLLGFTPSSPRGSPYSGAQLPPSDRSVFARLSAALDLEGVSKLVPWSELESPGGGLFDFAYEARGIYPLLFSLPAEDELAAGGFEQFAQAVRTRALRCLTLLPRIELTQEGLERVASDTWQLDVRIQNVGIVPTSSAVARSETRAEVAVSLEGARLVATAKRPSEDATFGEASLQQEAPLSAGTLAGGEGRWLRLFLQAPSGAEVSVTAASPRGGSARLRVTLP